MAFDVSLHPVGVTLLRHAAQHLEDRFYRFVTVAARDLRERVGGRDVREP